MTRYDDKITALLKELEEAWEYNPFPSAENGVVVYLSFANKMTYMTACGILHKTMDPDKWAMDADNDGRIALFVPRVSNFSGGNVRIQPLHKFRRLMTEIGYIENEDYRVEVE